MLKLNTRAIIMVGVFIHCFAVSLPAVAGLKELCAEKGGAFDETALKCVCRDTHRIIVPVKESCADELVAYAETLNHLDEIYRPQIECVTVSLASVPTVESGHATPADHGFIAEIEKKMRFAQISGGWKSDLVDKSELAKLKEQSKKDEKAMKMYLQLAAMKAAAVDTLEKYRKLDERNLSGIFSRARENRLYSRELNLIVQAKKDLISLLNKEGAYLHLPSVLDVIEHSKKLDAGWKVLNHLANLQSPALDETLNQDIVRQRRSARSESKAPLEVVVEGAGPNGLYVAIQQFMAGNNVRIVNDRGEDYSRKQIVGLDPKWTAQLRYLLGTKFDEVLLGKKWSSGRIPKMSGTPTLNPHEAHLHDYSGDLSAEFTTRTLEDTLKRRLVEIASIPRSSEDPGVLLDYNLRVESVIPPKSGEGETKAGFKIKLAGTKVTGKGDRGRLFDRSEETAIHAADMLILAGGANDKLRERYLSPVARMTDPVMYSVGTWIKKKKPGRAISKGIFEDHEMSGNVSAVLPMPKLAENLRAERIEEWIATLPGDLATKYASLIEKITAEAKPTSGVGAILDEKSLPGKGWEVRKFENNKTVYFGLHTPAILQSLRADLEKTPDGPAKVNELDRHWFHACIKGFVLDPSRVDTELELDSEAINHTVFPLAQVVPKTPARVFSTAGGRHLLVTVAGDANVAPHFFSGSGLTSGRKADNDVVEISKLLAHDRAKAPILVEKLRKIQSETQTYSLMRGSKWLPPSTSDMQSETARASTEALLKSVAAQSATLHRAPMEEGKSPSGPVGGKILETKAPSRRPESPLFPDMAVAQDGKGYLISFPGMEGKSLKVAIDSDGHLEVIGSSPKKVYTSLGELHLAETAGVRAF